jgi:hypothetical protein
MNYSQAVRKRKGYSYQNVCEYNDSRSLSGQCSYRANGQGVGKKREDHENQNLCEQNENMSYKWPVLLQSVQLSSKKSGTGYDNKKCVLTELEYVVQVVSVGIVPTNDQ